MTSRDSGNLSRDLPRSVVSKLDEESVHSATGNFPLSNNWQANDGVVEVVGNFEITASHLCTPHIEDIPPGFRAALASPDPEGPLAFPQGLIRYGLLLYGKRSETGITTWKIDAGSKDHVHL
ncbi:predicted protein [Histoplasma capsulatum G186AR]|uniref:Uncharacterized protein n=1 Tax=Ajellomyces capsulatus (strain G186AR / H82 / ATCC MYA-2454 / RMSCC 2432) TaxID=447093 RepID=C0NYH4_AJECG|nr:uncharacterized protein HCBG_07656 [Histoplasma capsulatum G186AR]EEH03530.1 predicted protein [Histoplasma capsulatum G186AR]